MEALVLQPNRHSSTLEREQAITSTSRAFIEANTIESSMDEVRNKHIIPVYAKDNERLISIAEFIDACSEIVQENFSSEIILQPNIRLSHPIKGRVPEAKDKAAIELQEWEKTLYFERAAFVIEVPSIQRTIDGNTLSLTIGGVKAYHLDRLNGKKGVDENFSFFIGYQNKVCTNLCVWTDGYSNTVGVKNLGQLKMLMNDLIVNYNASEHLFNLEKLNDYELSEHQFAQLIGRCRMYQNLPTAMKNEIAPMLYGDAQLNAVVKDYYRDNSFCRSENGNISLWRLYNLFTGVNKSSYIDSFLDRSVNAYSFVEQIKFAMDGKAHSWFLS
ncbi:MAG: DUF3871 family protein [Bacteroidetes bacterium]|nr:DUF3871 family protein [Bacteroidota bacterium]